VQAKGLRKHSGGRLVSLEQAVFMYVEREAFRQQGLTAEVQLMDETVCRGLLQRDKVDKFWASVLDVILEKMSRTLIKHRSTLPDDEVQAFVVTREA